MVDNNNEISENSKEFLHSRQMDIVVNTFDGYTEIALTTKIYNEKYKYIYTALGLVNESGEVAGKIKKILRDNDGVFTDENKKEIAKELGDVLWYLAVLSDELGINLSKIAKMNLEKLLNRKERGVLKGSGDNR